MSARPPRDNDSDSEDDSDYAPPVADEESSSSESEQPDLKRPRTESPRLNPQEEEERKRALWESFRASVKESSSPPATVLEPKKTVKVQKKYLFAGEEVVEVVEVPEDSVEAKKWPLWTPPAKVDTQDADTSREAIPPAPVEAMEVAKMPVNAPAPTKRVGPRKPKTKLMELPSATKAKKLTTLDKSVMDWKAHVWSSENVGLQEELEANRRGGGYLEKVEFLKRVDERKDEVFEAAKGSKRRRG